MYACLHVCMCACVHVYLYVYDLGIRIEGLETKGLSDIRIV